MKSEQNCSIVTIGYWTLLGPERRRIDKSLSVLSNVHRILQEAVGRPEAKPRTQPDLVA
jgi:hypothetical protein